MRYRQVRMYGDDADYFDHLRKKLQERFGIVDNNPKLFKFIHTYLQGIEFENVNINVTPPKQRRKQEVEVYRIE